jgi:ATP-dependent DNA helicase RecG
VLLGVENDSSISGIKRADIETWLMDTVLGRYVHPQLYALYEEVDMGNGRKVGVLSFDQGTSKPYVVRTNGREDVYVRLGSTSRLASREQQISLFQSGDMLHAEVLPVSGTGFDDLDKARLEDYMGNIINDSIPVSKEEWQKRLRDLGFMVTGADGKDRCTIAGLALFGYKPHRRLAQAGIRWMSFEGNDMDYKAQDDVFLDGPLAPLGKGSGGLREKIYPGLIEMLIDRMLPFISEESNKLSNGVERETKYYYALDAVREALFNAMAHRDWTMSLEVSCVNYSDRLVIESPGPLRNSMTVESMLAGQRSVRNPIITETLRDYHYMEDRGMGVRRKIVPLTRKLSGKDPHFEASDTYLRLTLPRPPKA